MESLKVKYKYVCVKECSHWGQQTWEVGEVCTDEGFVHERPGCFDKVEVSLKERFDGFRKGMKLSYADVAGITGNTEASVRAVINSGRVPNWVKLSIWMYETGQFRNPLLNSLRE
jgi:hypothetical protein